MGGRPVDTAPEGVEGYVRSMEVRVLGPVDVRVDGESLPLGGVKQRALLALLIAGVPEVVSVDRLIEGIWGEEPTRGARSTLQTYVSNLRQVLGDVITHERGGYRLDVDPARVDAVVFTRALERARTGVVTDPASTAADLRSSLATWRGLPYADLMSAPGLDAEVRRLEELRLEAVELRIDAELASGHHTDLIAELEALAEEHPTRERFRAQHMTALYRSGRQAEALRAYRRTEEYLAEELGVDPSPELGDLELRILEHDESLLIGQSRSVTQRLAFMVTDIEGSTRLWDEFPHAMAGALATHDRLLGEAIEASGGRIFKHTGDGVLAVFGEASAAVAAAEQAQWALVGYPWEGVDPLEVRMGIDVGEAEARDSDFFGPPLNRAARLCAIAHGGQVLVSGSVTPEVIASAPAGLQIRNLGEVHLRGMATPERVSQMVFVGLPADFPPPRSDTGGVLDERVVVALPGYEVREKIGEGAFGVVWRAYQPSVGREVAVKVIRPELASQPSFVRRFEAEARTVARLAHPHIVPLIDFWRDTDGAYLVLGLLPGGSLDRVMATGEVEVDSARRILAQVGSALDHAHSQNLPHGDLKPANVLLDGAGNAYLSDFGIPTRLMDRETITSIESAPEYRAPEMPETGPTPEADHYALGMLARNLLEGAPEIVPVLSRATAANPADRYPNATAFLDDLDSALGDLRAEPSPVVVSRNPFKGLRAFDEADAADFYGRADLVSALLAAVTRHRFVAVVGPSGSGKSSVVRAGLLPALAAGRVDGMGTWFHVVFTPGPRPMESMVEALERVLPGQLRDASSRDLTAWLRDGTAGAGVVMVVDQFEEIYTQVEEPERRRRFVEMLTAIVEDEGLPVRVAVTLRADYYDRPLADERLGPLVRSGQVTVLPPTRDELVEMITGPSQAVGLRWEPGLPHRITEDVAHQSGALPLLQYALTELVERRSGGLLTGADYERIGEVAGALAGRAEAIYRGFDPSQQEAARQVLLRLVSVDEESDDTRRRVRRSELESLGIERHHLDAVLDALVAERLLLADRDPVTRGPTIEVAHEALLREWPRLAGWIDEQREALILGRRLRAALDEWESSGRDDGYLLTGSRLAPFIGWAEAVALTGAEREFYAASQAKDDAERQSRRRRRRTLTAVLAGATVVASVLGVVAAIQAAEATRQAERADAQAAIALDNEAEAERQATAAQENAEEADQLRELAEAREAQAVQSAQEARANELVAFSRALVESDPALAKLLAVSATRYPAAPTGMVSLLHDVLRADGVTHRFANPAGARITYTWADYDPATGRVVIGGTREATADRLIVYEPDGREAWSWATGDPRVAVEQPRFSDGGALVYSGIYLLESSDQPTEAPVGIGIWDALSGDLLEVMDLGMCGARLIDLSSTHFVAQVVEEGSPCAISAAIAGEADRHYILRDLAGGDQRVISEFDLWSFTTATFSGDGRFIAYYEEVDGAGSYVVEEVETGQRVFEAQDDFSALDPGVKALNHDGSLLVTGSRPVTVWDVASGTSLTSLGDETLHSESAAFAPEGDILYMTTEDGNLAAWDASGGLELNRTASAGVGNVTVTSDAVLVGGDFQGGAAVVDRWTSSELWSVRRCQEFVLANTLSLGGGRAHFAEACGEGYDSVIVDLASRSVVSEIPGGFFQGMALAPDGSTFVRLEAAADGSTQGPVTIRDALTGAVIATLEGTCSFDVYSPVHWTQQEGCGTFPDMPFAVFPWKVTYSPDGDLVAISNAGTSTEIVLWDARSGEFRFGYGDCGTWVEEMFFSPDGTELYVSCAERARIDVVSAVDGTLKRSHTIEENLPGLDRVGFIGLTPDGETLVAVTGVNGSSGSTLLWLDSDSLDLIDHRPQIHRGTVRGWDLSPSGRLAATGSASGEVKVWDSANGEPVAEFSIGADQVSGVRFVSEDELAVALRGGGLHVYTLDPEELVEMARSTLTRGFTDTECDRFGFGDDCPTLDELREGEPVEAD